ncbi:MAG: molybdopterin-dependent oxidoreductase, partial [Myxococcales bacterium]|nr:molybdopterin-dependent oxidoreductase [Myxococcales bacterium]
MPAPARLEVTRQRVPIRRQALGDGLDALRQLQLVVQGVGQALMEDYRTIDGHATTDSFAKYILPTS